MKRTMVGTSVAVVLFGASAMPIPASADQISSTRDQVRTLEAAVVSGATQIRQLTLVYDQDSLQASTLAQQVTADETRLAELQSQVSDSRTALREDAIMSYTGGAAAGPPAPLGGVSDPSVRAEYLDVAAGDLSDAVDQYRTQERLLAAAEQVLAHQQQAAQNAAIATSAARQAALVAAGQEQGQLGVLQAKLVQLEAAAALAAADSRTQGQPVGGGMLSTVRNLVSGGGAGGVWLQLRECESGNNYRANTGNGFYGAYQFSESTWRNLGYPGRADLEPPAMQDQGAMRLQQEGGWGQWPACSAALGLH